MAKQACSRLTPYIPTTFKHRLPCALLTTLRGKSPVTCTQSHALLPTGPGKPNRGFGREDTSCVSASNASDVRIERWFVGSHVDLPGSVRNGTYARESLQHDCVDLLLLSALVHFRASCPQPTKDMQTGLTAKPLFCVRVHFQLEASCVPACKTIVCVSDIALCQSRMIVQSVFFHLVLQHSE